MATTETSAAHDSAPDAGPVLSLGDSTPSTRPPRRRRLRPDASTDSAPALVSGDSDTKQERLTLPLRPDGVLDVARMRDKTLEQLATALADPSVAGRLGNPSGAVAVAQAFDQKFSGLLWGGISQIGVALAMRAGYSPTVAQVAALTPDETALLVPATSKILNKYCGNFGPYQDEFELLSTLALIVLAKIQILQAHAATELAKAA